MWERFSFNENQGTTDLREVIDIRDASLDIDEILARIDANMQKRGWAVETAVKEWEDPSFGKELGHFLHKLSISHNQIGTRLILTESRVPVFGAVWQRVRRNLHYLVLFYLNLVTKKQIEFNSDTVQTFIVLIKYLAHEQKRTRAELMTLKQQMARLEAANAGLQVGEKYKPSVQ